MFLITNLITIIKPGMRKLVLNQSFDWKTRSRRLNGHLHFLMAFTANDASWTLSFTFTFDKSAIFSVIVKNSRCV